MDTFLSIIKSIYHHIVLIFGNIGIIVVLWLIIRAIVTKLLMRSSIKKYVKAIKESQFLDKTFGKMSDEEKKIYEENNGKVETKVSFNPQTKKVKVKTRKTKEVKK